MTAVRLGAGLLWLAVLALAAAELLLLAWFGYRLASYPENHLGFSPYLGLGLALPGLGAGLLGLFGARLGAPRLRRVGAGLVILSLGLVAVLAAFDRFNILIDYETWLQRGMPPRPF
ncbi:hypothetical protein [Roseospira goensis]|uniref:Uncharacterized protein n=1 Tax=Roseospira goensis TaxID=391922 RepID=A0A7W6RZF0_9PROT|nr:hypothetical protein [Roseospira goensis]MBB4286056.1 hypothetical protein [Roseospira goensis]